MTSLTEAVRRLWPAIEKAMQGMVFTTDKAGEVQADMNTVRALLAEPAAPQASDEEIRQAAAPFAITQWTPSGNYRAIADHVGFARAILAIRPAPVAEPAASGAKVPWTSPVESILRAMAENYRNGHEWDYLDSATVLRAAKEIEELRAASAQGDDEPVPLQHAAVAEDGVLRWMSGRKFKNCELYCLPDGSAIRSPLYRAARSKREGGGS